MQRFTKPSRVKNLRGFESLRFRKYLILKDLSLWWRAAFAATPYFPTPYSHQKIFQDTRLTEPIDIVESEHTQGRLWQNPRKIQNLVPSFIM